jgi:acetoacetyl-CoA synthetase
MTFVTPAQTPAFVPQVRLFQDWLAETRDLHFEDYAALWKWSVSDLEAYWRAIWAYDRVLSPTPFDAALVEERMPGAVWFKGATVNYATQVFSHAKAAETAGMPAIISDNEVGEARRTSWSDLKRQTASLALTLKELGVSRGDRVVAYMPNIAETIVSFLACSSLGAIWSVCAPDMGIQAVTDRFAQIEPKVLIAADGIRYAGKAMDRSAQVRALMAALPSVEALILLNTPYADGTIEGALRFSDAIARTGADVDGFEPEWLPFDHPVWVVYSSGTTGLPKPIVHSQGGVIVTAYSAGKLTDVGASYHTNSFGERYHWFSSTGWIMWNAQLSGLLAGATICLYDGSPSGSRDAPDWGVLWRFAAKHRVTFFGSGAAFYAGCKKAGADLAQYGDLSAIRALGSTGSPLAEDVQAWGTGQFAAIGTSDIWWCNISGGTDFASNFCTCNRELPQQPGKMQCRQLGAAVYAWNEAGEPVIDEVGELVCTRPIPSMPIFFWRDEGRARYLSSYFDVYPGVWRQGDWLKIDRDGACTIYGRSDATINRFGLRMGTSEIYAAVEPLPEILDSLVLDLEYLGRDSYLALFVVLREGHSLDQALKDRINGSIRTRLSPRFVPDEIIEAPEIPRTLSGKKQEVPIKKLFLGHPPEKVMNPQAMANPACIDWYVNLARKKA